MKEYHEFFNHVYIYEDTKADGKNQSRYTQSYYHGN